MNRRTAIAVVLTALALGATAAGGWWFLAPDGPADPPVPDEARPEGLPLAAPGTLPDLVLITIDTVRRDHFSSYGYERSTTPFIDELAADGVRFTRAWSTSSWTLPSVASTITGVWPASHGLLRGSAANREVLRQEALDPSLPNLPETLQSMGYRTWGLTANGHLDARFGFGRGFDRYACRGFNVSRAVRPVLRDFAAELQEGPPFFLWLHIFDPHAPYARRDGFDEWAPNASWRMKPLRDSDLVDLRRDGALTPAVVDEAVAAYDSEIRHDDAMIRELFERLPRARDAFTLITSDHGEEFDDHGGFGHRSELYDELTRVPLIVRDPRSGQKGVVDRPASLVDVFPTLVAAAGGEVPAGLPGSDLMADLDSGRPIFLEVSRNARRLGVVRAGFKLIYDPARPAAAELYDLEADPGETRNLASRRPELVAELRELVEAHQSRWKRAKEAPWVEVDDDHIDQLKAVGYVEDD